MPVELLVALIGATATLFAAGGIYVGHVLAARASAREAAVKAKASESTAEHKLIDQLQEELARYRTRTDARLDHLEAENRGYRAFIGIQRDHMAEHGIPLPPWPEGLPR